MLALSALNFKIKLNFKFDTIQGHNSTGVSGTIGGKLVSGSLSISPASRSNVQYNPAGDIKGKMKTSSLEIGFLGTFKLD